jgi:hypothetical protein
VSTEVWFRNPHDYIRELVECGEGLIAWDRGLLVKRSIDPCKHAELFFGESSGVDYRILTVGHQGSAEYRKGGRIEKPVAVYPTWVYGESSIILEEMIQHPVGEDMAACMDTTVPPDERPVPGQEHRVIITNPPEASTGPGRQFLSYLRTIQEDHPEVIIHIHGLYSWRYAFGMGFRAADVEPRAAAAKGKVHTPSGSVEKWERLQAHPQWATSLGFKPADLSVPRNRCMYNIKSAVWAGKNYMELFTFRTRANGVTPDYDSSDEDHKPATTKSPFSSPSHTAKEGDKMLCDTCSLQDKCKYFRSGAVCTVPGAEPVKLAHMFKTRDADQIIDALGTIVAGNANRLERGLKIEENIGENDPEVTKMMGQVFDQGVKLAKLLEPQRFSPGSKVQVNVGAGGAAAVSGANPSQLVAAIFRQLEQQGIPRDKITPEMVQGVLEGAVNPDQQQKAIAGTVLSSQDE